MPSYFAPAVTFAIMLFLALPASANREAATATGTAWPEYSKLDNLPKRTPQEIYATACGYIFEDHKTRIIVENQKLRSFNRDEWMAQWRNKYNGQLATEAAAVDAIRAAVAVLPEPEIEVLRKAKGEAGIGISFAKVTDLLGKVKDEMVVVNVQRLSQASLAGLRHKDVITAVDGKPTPLYIQDVLDLINGSYNSKVRVQFRRNGSLLETTLLRTTRLSDPQENVSMMLGTVAYVRPFSGTMNSACYQDLVTALKGLETAHPSPSGVILDLRDINGEIADGTFLSTLFVPKGTNVQTAIVNFEPVHTQSNQNPIVSDLPMVALVNGGTEKLAEVTADVFRSCGRATLVGDHTFGCLYAEKRIWLDADYSLSIRRHNLVTAEKKPIHCLGIDPDKLVDEKSLRPDECAWYENVKPGSTPSPGLKNSANEIADKQLRVALSVLKAKAAEASTK